jgi:hypothetical protein
MVEVLVAELVVTDQHLAQPLGQEILVAEEQLNQQ